MIYNLIVDSSCDLMRLEDAGPELGYCRVPFIISVKDRDFVDQEGLNVVEMIECMERETVASHTSCPSPQSWLEQFEREGAVIAMTISSNLSGSYNSACTAKTMLQEKDPDKKIFVLDSKSTGPELVLAVRKAVEWIQAGWEFEKICQGLEAYVADVHVLFALQSFGNLVKNGRMNKVIGFVAGKLKMWITGMGSDAGTIEVRHKARGENAVMQKIIDDMVEKGFSGGRVAVSHCQNPVLAEKFKNRILEQWGQTKLEVLEASGLDSYYAERGGLIVAFETA